jgi:hypothetical protein
VGTCIFGEEYFPVSSGKPTGRQIGFGGVTSLAGGSANGICTATADGQAFCTGSGNSGFDVCSKQKYGWKFQRRSIDI